jgi:hypothetical protein
MIGLRIFHDLSLIELEESLQHAPQSCSPPPIFYPAKADQQIVLLLSVSIISIAYLFLDQNKIITSRKRVGPLLINAFEFPCSLARPCCGVLCMRDLT